MTAEETKIIKGCKKGNKRSQYQFYELFKKLVFSVVMRYAKDVPEAEDMMQDTFIKLYRDLAFEQEVVDKLTKLKFYAQPKRHSFNNQILLKKDENCQNLLLIDYL